MDWLFVVPLSISVVSVYIAQKSEDEITYLTGTVAAVSLVLSLILAPWQIQLLILLLAILGTRQLWFKFEQKEKTQPSSQPQTPNTTTSSNSSLSSAPNSASEAEIKNSHKYRGVVYEPQAEPINRVPEKVVKKYRGAPIIVESVEEIPTVLPPIDLKYRGVKIPNSQNDETEKINNSVSPPES